MGCIGCGWPVKTIQAREAHIRGARADSRSWRDRGLICMSKCTTGQTSATFISQHADVVINEVSETVKVKLGVREKSTDVKDCNVHLLSSCWRAKHNRPMVSKKYYIVFGWYGRRRTDVRSQRKIAQSLDKLSQLSQLSPSRCKVNQFGLSWITHFVLFRTINVEREAWCVIMFKYNLWHIRADCSCTVGKNKERMKGYLFKDIRMAYANQQWTLYRMLRLHLSWLTVTVIIRLPDQWLLSD